MRILLSPIVIDGSLRGLPSSGSDFELLPEPRPMDCKLSELPLRLVASGTANKCCFRATRWFSLAAYSLYWPVKPDCIGSCFDPEVEGGLFDDALLTLAINDS